MEKKCFFFGLDSTFGRPQKRGAEVGAAAILGGMGLFGGIMSSNSQAEANAANLHYSKAENEKNRKFSHDERVDQNEWEADQYYKRLYTTNTLYKQNFNDQQQAAYDLWLKENDPNNLLPAYQKAGFNVSALAGDMGSGMISPSSTPVPSAQSPSSGSSSGAPAALGANQVATGGAAAQMISSIGGLIKSLASAGKDNADMQSVLKLLTPKFENIILQNQGLELMNQYSAIQNKYADAFKSEELRKLTNEADDTLVSAWLKSIQGHYVEEQTITEKLDQVLKGIDIEIGRTKSEQEKQNLEKLKIEAGLWHQNILSQIKVNNAKSYEASMSGDLKKAQAATESINKDIRQLERDILAVDANPDVLSEKLNTMVSEWKAKGWISDADAEEAKLRFSRAMDHETRRNKNSVFREVDSATDWLKSKISIFK